MNISTDKLRELLVEPGHVTADAFDSLVQESERKHSSIEHLLTSKGLVTDENLGKTIADAYDFHFVDLKKVKISEEALAYVPEAVARSRGVIAFNKTDTALDVAMTDPTDAEMRGFLEKRAGVPVRVFYATDADMRVALARYGDSVVEALSRLIAGLEKASLSKDAKEQGIIDLVDTILQYANSNGASDVHFDPLEQGAILRYRVDGILHDILTIDPRFVDLIVSRIKILAKMRTDEHRAAQDGKLTFVASEQTLGIGREEKKNVDVRVSVVPTAHGENVVMRLLTADNRSLTLDDLGFSTADGEKIRKAIQTSAGMLLVTGPTGSGKTTTLYGILKILNKREINIATIEDPIEYTIDGITQIQVNVKTDLTFANGLRSIVRQDPNVIMVGEIRDHETADIAVNSAMTGHLVLSTLHTNDAATALPRLLDMGIEPFLIASTVNCVVAQRLVRKICEQCRTSYHLTTDEIRALQTQPNVLKAITKKTKEKLEDVRLYKGTGCKTCDLTGYAGRTGIYEILSMSPEVKEAILKHSSSDEIAAIAVSQGMMTMIEDGMDKALQGITTIEEVLRVASSEYVVS